VLSEAAAQAAFMFCRSRSCSIIARCNWARRAAQFEYWFWTCDVGQPGACGLLVQTSLPARLVAVHPPCPFETVRGPQAGTGGHFFPVQGLGGGGGQFLPTHGRGAFASSGRRRWNNRFNQLCGLVVGFCGLTFAGIACGGFDFTFSELRRLLRAALAPPRSEWDTEWLELEFPGCEPWFAGPAEECVFEPPELE